MNKPLLELDEALARLLAAARRVKGMDRVPVHEACGRILAEPVVSAIAVPSFDNSAMDGYALRVADLTPGVPLKVSQRIAAGCVGVALEPGSVARIFTGAPIPPGADAVVMQEDCRLEGDAVLIEGRPVPGNHIRRAGEDIEAGAEVLAAGTLLTPQAIGLAASVGIPLLPVFRPLSVALLSTGDELVAPGEPLSPGGIYNSNKPMLLAWLRRLGCQVEDMGRVDDTLDATRRALRRAGALHDLVITTGGVSVGEEDHVKAAVEAEGELSLWSIAIKPGKPLAFGKVGNADFVGLPGNPVSAFVTFALLVCPFIRACQGRAARRTEAVSMIAGFDWPKPTKRREFLRVRIDSDGRLALFPNQSSAVLTSTVWADGLVDNPAGQVIRVGDTVRFIPMHAFQ